MKSLIEEEDGDFLLGAVGVGFGERFVDVLCVELVEDTDGDVLAVGCDADEGE